MAEGVTFFADLSIVVTVAALVGLLFSRWNLPLTVGYILAGMIVGPSLGPALIKNEASIRMLSDLGVMFLMFSIGLGFSFRKVRQLGGAVVFPAVWDVAFMVIGGFCVGRVLGWGPLECFLLGLILCDSSTSIAAKTLESLGWLGRRFADSTFAIALIEDVLAILLIAVLNGVTGGLGGGNGADWGSLMLDIGKQLGVLALFLVGVTVIGILAAPRLMNYVTERFGDEIVLMTALGICCAVSCLAQNGLNLSLVVGAFLAGAILSEARSRTRVGRVVSPVTNLFGAVFFISVGLQVDPAALWANAGTIVFITLAMIALKLVNNTVACLLVGEEPRDAFKVGLGMGQVAEFSFIIAGIAIGSGGGHPLTERPLYQIAVGVALLCTATNPYLLRASDRLYALVGRAFPPRLHDLLHWYRRWIANLATRQSEGGQSALAHIRGHVVILGLQLAMILIVFAAVYLVATIPAVDEVIRRLDGLIRFLPLGGVACAVAALILSAPGLWAAGHTWSEIVRHAAEEPFAGEVHGLHRVRGFVKTLLKVVGWTLLAVYVAMLCSGFVSASWLLALLILAAGFYVVRYNGRFRVQYKESHETLREAFDVNALPPEEPVSISALAVHTETVTLPARAAVGGKTLGELDLRKQTGAAVISVSSRQGGLNVSPGRDTLLRPGDSLILVGSDAELEKALALLTHRA